MYQNAEVRQAPVEQPIQQSPTYSGSLIKGLYLYGGSGCGKTYLSELFFKNLPIKEKLQTHFHEFMATVQRDLFKLEKVRSLFMEGEKNV